MTLAETSTKTMQAARFYAPGDVRIEHCERPAPQAGEILIQVEVALTCGTDLKAFKRGHPVLLGEKLPAPFGHECVGKVVAIGDSISKFNIGDRVVPANSAPCESCYFCTRKQYTQCESLTLLNGAYAEYLLIPERIASKNTYKVPDSIDAKQLACAEVLAVCLRGIEACDIQPNDTVAIFGVGPIGQIMATLAKQQGATITLIGRNPEKLLSLQKTLGAESVLALSEKDNAYWKQNTASQKGFDIIIEAVGLTEAWESATQFVRPGGKVLFFGGCPSTSTVNLSTHQLHYQEVQLLSTFHHTPRHFANAVDMLASGKIDLSYLVTHVLPLQELPHAFELMTHQDAIKVAIIP